MEEEWARVDAQREELLRKEERLADEWRRLQDERREAQAMLEEAVRERCEV